MKAILNHNSPEILEKKRIDEIRGLSFFERLERLRVIMTLSYELKVATKIIKAQ